MSIVGVLAAEAHGSALEAWSEASGELDRLLNGTSEPVAQPANATAEPVAQPRWSDPTPIRREPPQPDPIFRPAAAPSPQPVRPPAAAATRPARAVGPLTDE